MARKKDFYKVVNDICRKDLRYKADSYGFLLQALHFTQSKLKKPTHVTGKELLFGIRDFAIEQYGPMAKTVLSHWGITNTLDFGNIVFNMVDCKLLSKTDSDSLDDFKGVYDFEAAFGNIFRDNIPIDIK